MTARAAILKLLDERGPGKTICPSEAARQLAAPQGDWRAHMDAVHTSVEALLEEGAIVLTRKGQPLDQRRGAYRIARR